MLCHSQHMIISVVVVVDGKAEAGSGDSSTKYFRLLSSTLYRRLVHSIFAEFQSGHRINDNPHFSTSYFSISGLFSTHSPRFQRKRSHLYAKAAS